MTANADGTRAAAAALLRGDAIAEPHLLVIAGPERGRMLRLGPEQTVGRGRGADLRIADPSASRVHVRLSRIDGGFVAADLGSKNGLWVNGRRCGGRPLLPGDELALGETCLRLEPGALDRIEPPPAEAAGAVPSAPARETGGAAAGRPTLLAGAALLVALAALLLAP